MQNIEVVHTINNFYISDDIKPDIMNSEKTPIPLSTYLKYDFQLINLGKDMRLVQIFHPIQTKASLTINIPSGTWVLFDGIEYMVVSDFKDECEFNKLEAIHHKQFDLSFKKNILYFEVPVGFHIGYIELDDENPETKQQYVLYKKPLDKPIKVGLPSWNKIILKKGTKLQRKYTYEIGTKLQRKNALIKGAKFQRKYVPIRETNTRSNIEITILENDTEVRLLSIPPLPEGNKIVTMF